MKKLLSLFAVIFVVFSLTAPLFAVKADSSDEEFRVGMEAGYPPFNWTQKTAANGAVKIDGSNQYANGYDVQISKKIADKLGKKLVIVKTKWDGLLPALTSGKIDAIIAGMSPTAERRKEIDFSQNYYTSQLVVVVKKDSKYADATSLANLSGAKITGQQGTFHYNLISQIPDVKQEPAMGDFSAMRVALEAGTIDGYVGERPEGLTAEMKNSKFKMLSFADGSGFVTNPEDTQTAVGMRKGDKSLTIVNEVLASISQAEQISIMDEMVALQEQPDEKVGFWGQVTNILKDNGSDFVQAAGMTLFISILGTFIGTFIGLLIGVFRTTKKSANRVAAIIQTIVGWIINVYVEVFRGTPMIVQAMVIYYGSAQFLGISMDKTLAALIIVSINTGAYMSEIVRGGIFAVDKGQFEAASALGMNHSQTMVKIVLPQVIRNILPATGNEFVINIKDTSVLNVISITELFFQGNTVAQQNYQYFQTFTIIATIYFILTFTITRILRFVEKKLDSDDFTTGANQMQLKDAADALGGEK
ncbi:glutamine ABC transporter substrate-binding protein [Lactococcus hodotermopsidis]|uniref:Glutamine ABC transporter substrate-binding protein n=1 Tax=Pseudolactococcus hodotermopsidis TaxID=2709157 RepID=A0A6A0B7W9_9LACT|nr:ABC transporter substrate-binding protein/permease [Lactococcus hodotermopsidis]GFH41509.1 glutamine ABC transporter substrate-binding protein [Lactococcus hodotermopsidis]